MFRTFRATRDIHLGQARRLLRAGDVVEFDGRLVRVAGVDHRVPTMDEIISKGWFVSVFDGPSLPAVVGSAPLAVATAPTPPVAEETNARGERVPYGSKEARDAVGARPEANKPHRWDTGPTVWGSGTRVCLVCGVTERFDLIRADRTRGDGSQQHHYVDAHGNAITTLEEMSCPTYIGDPGSAAALAKEHVRRVRGRVDEVEGHLETVDERLARLEAENADLRARLDDRPVLDADLVAEALLRIAERARATKQLETVQVRGEAYQIPATFLDVVGERVLEPEVIEAEVVEVEPTPKRRKDAPRRRR